MLWIVVREALFDNGKKSAMDTWERSVDLA